jgi:DNA primase
MNERESMYLVSEYAQRYFQDIMMNTDEGQAIGYSYFKERGFTGETIKSLAWATRPKGMTLLARCLCERL